MGYHLGRAVIVCAAGFGYITIVAVGYLCFSIPASTSRKLLAPYLPLSISTIFLPSRPPPRGEIPPPKTLGISARGSSLDGKKIVLIDNGKYGASNFLDALADKLKQKYPSATIVMDPKPAAQTITDLPKWYPTVKQQGDLFVFGVGD